MAFSLQVAGSMRSYILCCIPPVGRSCAYAPSMSRNHVLWKLTVFSREHQLRDYGRPGWGKNRGGEGRARKIRRVCTAALRVCTRWSKSTVLEARDIRSPEVIDTESCHGVQLDAPVILDSPLIYGLRREKGNSHRIRIRNESARARVV